jgi:hypothetical protein
MSQDGTERLKYSPGGNGQGAPSPEPSQRVKQAPGAIGVPAVAPARKTYTAVVPVQKVEPIGSDRGSRRLARQQEQQLAAIAFEALKTGQAIRSVQALTAFATNTMDQIQDDVMTIYYQQDRDPGMNELMKRVSGLNLQQAEAKIGVLTDLHFQNLTELMQHG